jgi:hypothetical protein
MDPLAAVVAVVVGFAGLVIYVLVERWWVNRTAGRIVAKIMAEGPKEPSRLIPESLYLVQISSTDVSCVRPDGKVERVNWDDLERVEILTTDAGPFAPDVFWVLLGSKGGCVIPQGATGEKELLRRLQTLPGFSNEAVIEAAPSTECRRFLCWEKGVGT